MAAMVRCSSSMECSEEFPAADPYRSVCRSTLQVPDSASVLDLKIPPPDLRPAILSSRSSLSEDMEALASIVPDTTEPYQTTIIGKKMHFLPFPKAGLSEDANKISRNLTLSYLQTTHTFIFEDAQTLSRTDTSLQRNVSFEKIQATSQAEATAIENLRRTSLPAVPPRTLRLHATVHQEPPVRQLKGVLLWY
ncbi:hypothetical protein MRX96_015901 [Rhipicephalus microplus]